MSHVQLLWSHGFICSPPSSPVLPACKASTSEIPHPLAYCSSLLSYVLSSWLDLFRTRITRHFPLKYIPKLEETPGSQANKTSEVTQALSLSMVHLFPSFSTFSINHTRYDFKGQPLHGFTQQMPWSRSWQLKKKQKKERKWQPIWHR